MDNLSNYFFRLGMFIHKFAEVEKWLLMALAKQAKVKSPLAQALFPGVRIDVAKTTIRRIREVEGIPESEILKRAFDQLTCITTLRNDLVHYGAQFQGDWEPHVSNQVAAMPGKERKTVATPELLNQATIDLQTIMTAIFLEFFQNEEENLEQSLIDSAQQPWRYKPAPPSHNRPPSSGKNPRQKPPLKSFAG